MGVKNINDGNQEVVGKVLPIMKQLSYFIPSAMLHRFLKRASKQRSTTLLCSTYQTLLRYCSLKPYLSKLDHEEVQALLLDADEASEVAVLMKRLGNLDLVTEEPKSDNTSLAGARTLFDGY